ncbi:MAG: hypothetical protein KC656_30580, partial [Myxococcales bacterium]|nr:hypothetical protein [Myxococcales bacterium]
MRSDTTDSSWDDERDSRTSREASMPEPLPELPPDPSYYEPAPQAAAASKPNVPSFHEDAGGDNTTGTYYPGFGVIEEEEEAATVRYSSAFDDDVRTAVAYSEYDDGPPPTDEVPSAVLQDVSQSYAAPMHVPEPPPIPGILDRFTPAGAAQRTSTSRGSDVDP